MLKYSNYPNFTEIVLVFFIEIYPGYYLIRPLQCIWYIKSGIGFIVSLFVGIQQRSSWMLCLWVILKQVLHSLKFNYFKDIT